MKVTPTTATALLQGRSSVAVTFALLRSLEKFITVYPRDEKVTIPECSVAWETTLECGPMDAVRDAIAMCPELWAHAVPEECCIVPRAVLARLLGEDTMEAMAQHGVHMVGTKANRARFALDQKGAG